MTGLFNMLVRTMWKMLNQEEVSKTHKSQSRQECLGNQFLRREMIVLALTERQFSEPKLVSIRIN